MITIVHIVIDNLSDSGPVAAIDVARVLSTLARDMQRRRNVLAGSLKIGEGPLQPHANIRIRCMTAETEATTMRLAIEDAMRGC